MRYVELVWRGSCKVAYEFQKLSERQQIGLDKEHLVLGFLGKWLDLRGRIENRRLFRIRILISEVILAPSTFRSVVISID